MKKKILIGLLVVFVIIQFFRIDKTNPKVDATKDFINVNQTPDNIAGILKTSCYDCHSYESKYPWYTNIAPVSWFVKHHINEGREHLNFSEWGNYSAKDQAHASEECAEEVEEGEMPLTSYTLIHGDAKLSKEDKALLESYFESMQKPKNSTTEQVTNSTKNNFTIEGLKLNNGEKWKANPETTEGIDKMIQLTSSFTSEPTIEDYQNLGLSLEEQKKYILNQCTMDGIAHDNLHKYLMPLIRRINGIKEVESTDKGIKILNYIKKHLAAYKDYFE